MKKLLLSILVLSGTAFHAEAQLKFGVKGGLNLATLKDTHSGSTPDIDAYKNKIGYHAGAIAQLPLLGKLSIQAEALYNVKGAKIENQDSDNTGPSLSYFSIPVLAVYKPGQKFGIEGGVEFSSVLSAKQTFLGKSTDIKSGLENTNDIGLVGGIQFQFTERLNFDARYVFGLTTIQKPTFTDAAGNQTGSVEFKNQACQFSLAYFLLK